MENKKEEVIDNVGTPHDMIILAGDHLGPLIWRDKDEATAMENAKTLVYDFVAAGYQKIHLDT